MPAVEQDRHETPADVPLAPVTSTRMPDPELVTTSWAAAGLTGDLDALDALDDLDDRPLLSIEPEACHTGNESATLSPCCDSTTSGSGTPVPPTTPRGPRRP